MSDAPVGMSVITAGELMVRLPVSASILKELSSFVLL